MSRRIPTSRPYVTNASQEKAPIKYFKPTFKVHLNSDHIFDEFRKSNSLQSSSNNPGIIDYTEGKIKQFFSDHTAVSTLLQRFYTPPNTNYTNSTLTANTVLANQLIGNTSLPPQNIQSSQLFTQQPTQNPNVQPIVNQQYVTPETGVIQPQTTQNKSSKKPSYVQAHEEELAENELSVSSGVEVVKLLGSIFEKDVANLNTTLIDNAILYWGNQVEHFKEMAKLYDSAVKSAVQCKSAIERTNQTQSQARSNPMLQIEELLRQKLEKYNVTNSTISSLSNEDREDFQKMDDYEYLKEVSDNVLKRSATNVKLESGKRKSFPMSSREKTNSSPLTFSSCSNNTINLQTHLVSQTNTSFNQQQLLTTQNNQSNNIILNQQPINVSQQLNNSFNNQQQLMNTQQGTNNLLLNQLNNQQGTNQTNNMMLNQQQLMNTQQPINVSQQLNNSFNNQQLMNTQQGTNNLLLNQLNNQQGTNQTNNMLNQQPTNSSQLNNSFNNHSQLINNQSINQLNNQTSTMNVNVPQQFDNQSNADVNSAPQQFVDLNNTLPSMASLLDVDSFTNFMNYQ